MSIKKTIFILGAGASMPYGLPSGADLRNRILARTHNHLNKKYLEADFGARDTAEFNLAFGGSGINSIDLFLSHPGNESFAEIGKFAIALEIAACENPTALLGCISYQAGQLQDDPNSSAVAEGWYKYLWNGMSHALDKFNENRRFAFITFNYDRSLEQFLKLAFLGMNSRAKLSEAKVREYLSVMEIIHVHGKLAALPWLASSPEEQSFDYGAAPRPLAIRELSKGIRIIHESRDEDGEFVRAQRLIQQNPEATVLFMGFGFHNDNLRRLGLDHKQRPDGQGGMAASIMGSQPFYATTMGMNARRLKELGTFMGRGMQANPIGCHQFIRDHI